VVGDPDLDVPARNCESSCAISFFHAAYVGEHTSTSSFAKARVDGEEAAAKEPVMLDQILKPPMLSGSERIE
jgi:hypothetical protein